MTSEGVPRHGGEGDGCLVVAIRLPIRILAVIVVLPTRLAWDALCAAGRTVKTGLDWVGRRVLYPPLRLLGLALARLTRVLLVIPAAALRRYVLAPVGLAVAWTVRALVRFLLVVPAVALWRYVLVPVGRGVRWCLVGLGGGAGWLVRVLVVPPAAWLWRAAVVPAALGVAYTVAFLLRWLLVRPVVMLWRYVVVPVAREVATALGHAWRVTAYLSRAVGRGIGWLLRTFVAVPVAWVWTRTVSPFFRAVSAAGRWCRREILRPVREALAEARKSVRQSVRTALFGAPRESAPLTADLRKHPVPLAESEPPPEG